MAAADIECGVTCYNFRHNVPGTGRQSFFRDESMQ